MTRGKFVSVIIPCRNEAKFIEGCIEAIVRGDYPKDSLEVLVVDGMSVDGTQEIVERCAKAWPAVRLLDNSKRITAVALNIGIRQARGDVIVIVGSHSRVERDYVSRCIEASETYSADNVGGVVRSVPREETMWSDAIVTVLSHPVGVGDARFRLGTREPMWVDTVFGGCYRREVFDRIGLFNERLNFSQDMEFNSRLRRAGGRILLVPEIRCDYYARARIGEFWRHNLRNGEWAILPFLFSSGMPVSWRHLAPGAFVSALVAAIALACVERGFWWLSTAIGGAYAMPVLAASVYSAAKARRPSRLVTLPVAFASLHLGYGLGSLWGLCRLLALAIRGVVRQGRGPAAC